ATAPNTSTLRQETRRRPWAPMVGDAAGRDSEAPAEAGGAGSADRPGRGAGVVREELMTPLSDHDRAWSMRCAGLSTMVAGSSPLVGRRGRPAAEARGGGAHGALPALALGRADAHNSVRGLHKSSSPTPRRVRDHAEVVTSLTPVNAVNFSQWRGPTTGRRETDEGVTMIARRHVLAAGAAGSAALALAACGGDSGGSGGEVDGEGKTLTMWLMEGTNASADAYIEELKTAFADATGATLDVQVQPWDGAHDKFVTAMAGGTCPDVAEVGTTWVPEFADAGGIDMLTEDIEAAGLSDGMVDGLVEAGTLDGEMYGMPWYGGVSSLLANPELLEDAGVDSQPESWDDLLTMITTLEEHDPDWISFPVLGASIFPAISFVWGAGGLIAEEQGGQWKATINAPEAVEGLTWYADLALEHNASTAAAATW